MNKLLWTVTGLITILSTMLADWTHLAQRHVDAHPWNFCNYHYQSLSTSVVVIINAEIATYYTQAYVIGDT